MVLKRYLGPGVGFLNLPGSKYPVCCGGPYPYCWGGGGGTLVSWNSWGFWVVFLPLLPLPPVAAENYIKVKVIVEDKLMGECNTILSAYTSHSQLKIQLQIQQYYSLRVTFVNICQKDN